MSWNQHACARLKNPISDWFYYLLYRLTFSFSLFHNNEQMRNLYYS